MDIMERKVKELENLLADLRKRLPAHSVRPQMLQEIEALEEELDRLKSSEKSL